MAQDEDVTIRKIKQALRAGHLIASPNDPPELSALRREWPHLIIKNGVLYRNTVRRLGKEISQFVLPKQLRSQVLRSLHDDGGALGD